MTWLWTWGGICFGYRDGDILRTHDGRHVGQFQNDEVYAPDGQYLGEIISDDRLITNKNKKHHHSFGFAPYAKCGAYARYANYAGYAMYSGYEDFPKPGDL